MLTRRKVIERLCLLQEEVSRHLDDYDYAADCFCKEGDFWDSDSHSDIEYRNDGESLRFIEKAVLEKIGTKGDA